MRVDETNAAIAIIGAGGHGKVAADIALRCGYDDVVFYDDAPGMTECAGFPVAGGVDDAMAAASAAATDFFVAIGNAATRERVQCQLAAVGGRLATLIHPAASIGRGVVLGVGTVVMPGAVVNADAVLGKGCIVNTGASVDHDCRIGDFAHIAVGANVAGSCIIGRATWVGAGAVVSNNMRVCDNCTIGAGAVVVRDITQPGTYVGVPAKLIKSSGGGLI